MIVAIIILGGLSIISAAVIVINWTNNQADLQKAEMKLREQEIELEITKARYGR